MIIQCEKCQTRFRLDDSRISDKGVKVRCTKCKHVFTVKREIPEAESSAYDSEFSFPSASSEVHQPAAESDLDTQFAAKGYGDTPPAHSASIDFSPFETSPFDASAISFESDSPARNTGSENDLVAAEGKTASRKGEIDFSDFEFDDGGPEPDLPALSAGAADDFSYSMIESTPVTAHTDAPQMLGFSDHELFGTVARSDPEGETPAESIEISNQETSTPDFSAEALFDLGAGDLSEKSALADEDTNSDQQELPPLSIATRRKQSPLFGALIALIAVSVISVLGYLGYSSFSVPKETAVPEAGKISVRNVKASFIKNGKGGELLVISGEALNEYPKPRAALQVKVTLFDAGGQGIATKMAYGGNPLTKEQLESLPLDKIEASMANQFGDSLINMEVAPGKAIPFVVVLANLPTGAKDFAIQSAGSTVATGKQP